MKTLNNHVVGFKVYNSYNELIYFANTKTFTIPKAVMETANNKISIKVCGSDGSEVDPSVAPTGISIVEAKAEEGRVNVYNLSGALVRAQVDAGKAVSGLPAGIYIVGGKKIVVR